MNDKQRAAMQMALRDLELIWEDNRPSITALREALRNASERMAQPQGEWVDLTVDEIHAAINELTEDLEVMMWRADYCRAVIAAFKEKNK